MSDQCGILPPGKYMVRCVVLERDEQLSMANPFTILRCWPNPLQHGFTFDLLEKIGEDEENDEDGI